MLKSLASFFHGFSLPESMKFREPNCTTTRFVYRDELNKKTPPSTMARGTPKKGRDCSTATGAVEEKVAASTVMRVKVKMTKQEAARLLAKCKKGGVLEFRDVARALVEIPASRIRIVEGNLTTTVTRKSTVLDSIPE
ncbi:hypothetical protein SLEP1_g40391 [Rubroshorea leprosula]|uniref:DUF7890 domain-containing protein n=1 Tax=Rubroshorea leprosula TaxID=152421 RepID=A0AAV5L4M5_9ROSI|nr:hypothetical protein SLEP1_g40391 [Rubroshorea leprosula]